MPTLAEAVRGLPRPVWLEIDVDALKNNVAVVREIVGPRAQVSAVVKADGYGHGMLQSALAFESGGVERLCVASLDEALGLRKVVKAATQILVLYPVPADGVEEAGEHRIDLTITEPPRNSDAAVHVEVETGLSRGGIKADAVAGLISELRKANARIGGIWTHLASPEDAEVSAQQLAEFDRATALVEKAGFPLPPHHVAATGGLFTGRAPHYEGVRIGLGMYGSLPTDLPIPEELKRYAARLRPAMALKARALRIETFPAGTRVGYGGRWTAKRESWIATLPVGYADAIPRPAPWGEALVMGRRVPLVGTIAMDAVMADVTDVMAEGIDLQDEFVLLGAQGSEQIRADELARARNTIPWEVATSMSHRVPRVYHAASVLVGLRTMNAETRVSSTGVTNIGDPHG